MECPMPLRNPRVWEETGIGGEAEPNNLSDWPDPKPRNAAVSASQGGWFQILSVSFSEIWHIWHWDTPSLISIPCIVCQQSQLSPACIGEATLRKVANINHPPTAKVISKYSTWTMFHSSFRRPFLKNGIAPLSQALFSRPPKEIKRDKRWNDNTDNGWRSAMALGICALEGAANGWVQPFGLLCIVSDLSNERKMCFP